MDATKTGHVKSCSELVVSLLPIVHENLGQLGVQRRGDFSIARGAGYKLERHVD